MVLQFGIAVTLAFIFPKTTWGYIAVDEHTQQMRVHLYPVDLKNGKIKKVIMQVVYGARIPLDETRE